MSAILGVHTFGTTAGGTSVATPGVTTTTGSVLVVFAQWEEMATFVSLTDTYSNASWQELATEINFGACKTRAWYHENTAGGIDHQVTVTIDTATPITVFLIEVQGAALTSALDGTPSGIQLVAPPWSSSSLTVTSAASIVIGAHLEYGGNGYYFHNPHDEFLKLDEECDGNLYFPGVVMARRAESTDPLTTLVTTENDANLANAAEWIVGIREAHGADVSELLVGLV